MNTKTVLIVDDEKNIRLTLSQLFAQLGYPARTAMNGEEALSLLVDQAFWLILLDLRMPGMDGVATLRHIRDRAPDARVVIITAHGSIESAVETMKLGAVDFIRKPFTPAEIRELVARLLERENLDENSARTYLALVELCKRRIAEGLLDRAAELAQRAVARDPGQPEAYNLLGALHEMQGAVPEAQKYYRAALDLDPRYRPARDNLERSASWDARGKASLGESRGSLKENGEAYE